MEAGGELAPGQSAFCAKICSKIITAQFCVMLLNNVESEGTEIPNANVNMEYGLMLGFNKYVIPFQRASQKLPFNVAGLDTVKYTQGDFAERASKAIDQAIVETQQDAPQPVSPDAILGAFLISKKALVTQLSTDGDRTLFQLGSPLGFNLLNDFSGMGYMYFGNFAALRPEVIIWRVKMLMEIIDGRLATMKARIKLGLVTEEQAKLLSDLFEKFQIWIAVTTDGDRETIKTALQSSKYTTEVFALSEITAELKNLSGAG